MTEPAASSEPDGDLAAAQAARRRRAVVILSAVVAIAVIAAVVVGSLVNRDSDVGSANPGTTSATDTVMHLVQTVPISTLNTIGPGHAVGAPEPVKDTALTAQGKPELLYIGAEFCPYCAGQRWALAVALSRFGTLDHVSFTTSSPRDADPNTATLDFVDTTYTSEYLSFVGIENEDRDHKLLRPVSKSQGALWTKYSRGARGYPFIDFGNVYAETGPNFDPAVLAGLTQRQIAARLADPADPVALSVDGAANVLTAAICGMTDNQPATVCGSALITDIKSKIDALPVRPPASTEG